MKSSLFYHNSYDALMHFMRDAFKQTTQEYQQRSLLGVIRYPRETFPYCDNLDRVIY